MGKYTIKWWYIAVAALGVILIIVGIASIDRPSMTKDEVCAYVRVHLEHFSVTSVEEANYLGDGKWSVILIGRHISELDDNRSLQVIKSLSEFGSPVPTSYGRVVVNFYEKTKTLEIVENAH